MVKRDVAIWCRGLSLGRRYFRADAAGGEGGGESPSWGMEEKTWGCFWEGDEDAKDAGCALIWRPQWSQKIAFSGRWESQNGQWERSQSPQCLQNLAVSRFLVWQLGQTILYLLHSRHPRFPVGNCFLRYCISTKTHHTRLWILLLLIIQPNRKSGLLNFQHPRHSRNAVLFRFDSTKRYFFDLTFHTYYTLKICFENDKILSRDIILVKLTGRHRADRKCIFHLSTR